jgi:hypothetical protein
MRSSTVKNLRLIQQGRRPAPNLSTATAPPFGNLMICSADPYLINQNRPLMPSPRNLSWDWLREYGARSTASYGVNAGEPPPGLRCPDEGDGQRSACALRRVR